MRKCQGYSSLTFFTALRRLSARRGKQRIPGKNQKIFIPVFTGTGFTGTGFLIFPGMAAFYGYKR
jgi:hypothetical protein